MEAILVLRPHEPEDYATSPTIGFKDLPEEIRKMVYPLSSLLAIPHDDSMLPNLLVALAFEKELFAEALEIYKRINVRVTNDNIQIFKCMRMKELLQFHHLKIVCIDDDPRENLEQTLNIRAHKMLLHNNLRSITYVIDENAQQWPAILDYVDFLVASSRTGVEKVTLKIANDFGSRHHLGHVKRLLWKLKVVGKLDERYQRQNTGYQVWVWEKPDGSSFKRLTKEEADEEIAKRKDQEILDKALILYQGVQK